MRLRVVALVAVAAVAVAAGLLIGAKVGRERSANRDRRGGRRAPLAFLGKKVKATGRLALEWLKDVAGTSLGWRDGDEAADAIAVDLAEELAQAINDHSRLAGSRPVGTRAAPGVDPAPVGRRWAGRPQAGRPARAPAQASSR